MIKCQNLSGSYSCTLQIIKGETVREFSIRLLDELKVKHDGKTNPFSFFSRRRMSSVLDKDLPVVDFIDKGLVLIKTSKIPAEQAEAFGNFQEGGFTPDLITCAICLEDYSDIRHYGQDRVLALNCGHRFHVRCLGMMTGFNCPSCRKPMNPYEIDDIKWFLLYPEYVFLMPDGF